MNPQIFWSVTSGPLETQVVLRTMFLSIFFDNFYNAFFQRRLVHNDGLDFVCQNSFLRCGQVNSVLLHFLKSSMNLMIHLPRLLCICNYFCFAGIVVETNCTLSMVEDKLYAPHGTGYACPTSVRVCTSPVQIFSPASAME